MTTIDPKIKDEITNGLLRELEDLNDVTVIYAIESGSRAWGFPSKNSDYDIRFIYYRPLEHYVSVSNKDTKDSIEYTLTHSDGNVYDFVGWDLRKALSLAAKSNPAILEWLMSPIRYDTSQGAFPKVLREYMAANFSLEGMLYHHLSLVKRTYLGYFGDERKPEVSEKKYLYAIRSLLAAEYLVTHQAIPPIVIHELLDKVPTEPAFREALNSLIARKSEGTESDTAKRIPEIEKFVVSKLRKLNDELLFLQKTQGPNERQEKERAALKHFDRFVNSYLIQNRIEPNGK